MRKVLLVISPLLPIVLLLYFVFTSSSQSEPSKLNEQTSPVVDKTVADVSTGSEHFAPTPSPNSSTLPVYYAQPTPTDTPTPAPTQTSTPNDPGPFPDPCAGLENSTYDDLVLGDLPVAYFPLNKLDNICDHSSSHYYAYDAGGVTLTSMPNGDGAIKFDGDTGFVQVANASGLHITKTGEITVEAWIRPDTLQFRNQESSGYVNWMGKGEAYNYEYLGRMYSYTNTESRPNRISGYAFNLTGGLGVGSYFQDILSEGSWIHYALVINTNDTNLSYPSGYTKIYKNGVERDQDDLSALSIIPGAGSAPLRIGTRDFASFFEGAIGKFAVYNSELTAYQILEHYQKMVPPIPGSVAFVQNVGDASSKTTGTTLSIPVTSAVKAGNTLIIRVLTNYTSGAPTITDSKGNTYTRDRTAPNSAHTIRASIYSANVSTALESGDTITVTSQSTDNRVAVVDEFSGVLSSSPVDLNNGTSGSSTTPGTSISIATTHEDDLILGFVGIEGPEEDTFTQDTLGQYTSLTRVGTTGGDDDSNLTIAGGYKSVGELGTFQYKPELSPSRNWILFVSAYKAE